MKRLIYIIISGLILGLAFGQGVIAGEHWKTPLKLQIKNDKGCTVKSFSKVRIFKLAGRRIVEGRAHCYSGVDFDFSWKPGQQKFEFKRCKPVVC